MKKGDDEYLALRLLLVALNELIDDQEKYVSRLKRARVKLIHEMGKAVTE